MRGERGFTLIEALVAFAILAVVLVALYEAMGTGLRAFDRAAGVDDALLVAQSELDSLAALKTLPTERMSGAVEGTTIRWRAERVDDGAAEPERLRASPLRLQKMRLTVSWVGDGATRYIAIERTLLVQRTQGG